MNKKQYNEIYRKNNKEQIKDYNKQWRKNNKEQIKQYSKQYYLDNKEEIKKYYKQWRDDNPKKVSAYDIKYRFLKENQTPDLTEEEQKIVDRLYEIRDLLNHDKVDFHVDHIQPISKGGLHHPDNLQILPNWLNSEKHNKWPPTEQEEIKYEGFRV